MPQPAPHPTLRKPHGPVVLCILDGVGIGAGGPDDAVATARKPNLDRLMATCPWRTLKAHGRAVGLPSDDDMGNSEVGHNAMGCGRVFDQGAMLINQALASGTAFGEVWQALCERPTLHLLGLCSDGNVHSHVQHLHRLLDRAELDGVKRVRLHLLTDGRDVGGRTALTWFEPLEARLADARTRGLDWRIASGGGRMAITMDRYEADWAMVERGWRLHTHGIGRPFPSASEAIRALYAEDPKVTDQWLPPFVVVEGGQPVGAMVSGDAVLLFNFRGDRALEICRAYEGGDVPFPRPDRPDVLFAGMMEYDGDLHIPARYLVAPPAIDRVVGEQLVAAGLRTFATSETQKFGHVTFFFNGNRSGLLDDRLEKYVEIPSDLANPDTRPWMKAAEITDVVIDAVRTGGWDHIRMNLANGDMVGHTGVLEATRVAIEAVDLQVGRLEEVVRAAGGVLLITADHGNADEMLQHGKDGAPLLGPDGQTLPRTSHTLNPVPFILVDPTGTRELADVPDAGIASLGATVIELCGFTAPHDYLPGLVRLREPA